MSDSAEFKLDLEADRFDPDDPRPQILMCPPDFYGIEYEINPWMSRDQPPDHALAARQWSELRAAIRRRRRSDCPAEAGARTARPGVHGQRGDDLSPGRHARPLPLSPSGRARSPTTPPGSRRAGFHVHRLQDDVYFEGAGDALFCGDTLFAGYRIRSDVRGLQQIGELFRCRVIPLELVDPYYYHLDTCFCPLAPGVAIYFPGAFDDYGRAVLKRACRRADSR